MGSALLRGLLRAGVYAPPEIAAFDADLDKTRQLAQEFGIVAVEDAAASARDAEIVLLAVKPQVVNAALKPLRGVLSPRHVLLSIAAGVSTAQLEAQLEAPVPVVRVMPNTPCLVGQAASAICLGAHATEQHRAQAHRIFDAVGVAVDVEEKLMDAVTGVSGSGPAYVYIFIEALADGGVRAGLPRATAQRLAAQTVLGAAQMVLETGRHPGELKDMVASPGGTTIAALGALEKSGFRAAALEAVEVAARRSQEMQQEQG
jgi:pyrroline-5-carboxylate reductase